MPSRYFALMPAAGHSLRMGRPKLLLMLAGQPLVAHTIQAWASSHIDLLVIVGRPGDDELSTTVRRIADLQSSGSQFQVEMVIPATPPPDMKASLQAALAHLEQQHQPTPKDAFLVAPADIPRLSPAIIGRLIERHGGGSNQNILVPTIAQQRGHPVLFPWPFAAPVFQLRENEGLNAIVEREPIELIACDDIAAAGGSPFADIDTPEQYNQITQSNLPDNRN